MIPFFALLLIPICMQHFVIRNRYISYEMRNKRALLFFFVILTVILMFRHESVGSDTRNYINYFNGLRVVPWKYITQQGLEVGFVVLNKIIGYITCEPQVFLAIVAIIIMALIYPTYRRLCSDTSLTIVLFCTISTFVMLFSGIRQMIAIAIGFVAYEFTRRKKSIPFILTGAVATMFHASAIMLFLMYPLYHAKITKKWLIVVIPGLISVFYFNKQIFSVLTFILERYTKYEGGITQTGAYTMLILFVAFMVFAFVIPDESKFDDETIGLRNFLMLSLALQMFAPLHMLAMRMNYYYIVFIPLLMPKIIACKSKRWSQVAVMGRHIMVIFFLLYFFINAYQGRTLNVFPYHFFWEDAV